MAKFGKRVNKYKSRKRFKRSARMIHKKNRRSPMRGGYRLV